MIIRFLAFVNVCCCAFAGCFPITGDRILARDLAVVSPEFSALPATLTVGFAPVPGSPRVFSSTELARLARTNGIDAQGPREACFEIPMHAMNMDLTLRSMRSSLPPDTEVSVLELPKENIPIGDLEFPVGGLEPSSATSAGTQMWHGFVRYTSTRRMPVWARVLVVQKLQAVVTSKDLPPNVPITVQALNVQTWSGQPVRERVAMRIEDVVGKVPKRALRAGSVVPLALLEDAPAVRRGESVRVEVRSGTARLAFSAVVERAGRDGELIEFRNPSTGKTFMARLEGAKAIVVVGAGL